MRGIYTAAFLERVATYFGRSRNLAMLDVGKGFDLITGTITGAIVGCAAAIGRPMAEVVSLYRTHGAAIFPSRISGKAAAVRRAFFGGNVAVRHGDAALRVALTAVLKEVTMLEVFTKRGIALSVPAVFMSDHRAYVFKRTATSGNRDDSFKLVDVCMASSAAPIYRSLAAIKDPNSTDDNAAPLVFADGGLWANNPVLVGLIDALLSAPADSDIQIFCLSTRPRPEGDHLNYESVHRSMADWWYGAKIAPVSITAQEFAYDNMARMLANVLTKLGRKVQLVRFPKYQMSADTLNFLDLDDTRKEAMDRLVAQALSDADATKSACDDPSNVEGALIRAAFENMPEMPKTGIQWGEQV